ncbi:MAG: hypothetical protein PUC29_01615 [Clostridia bacterium]|nr:hypothetical protein [Clostridia bacterium]
MKTEKKGTVSVVVWSVLCFLFGGGIWSFHILTAGVLLISELIISDKATGNAGVLVGMIFLPYIFDALCVVYHIIKRIVTHRNKYLVPIGAAVLAAIALTVQYYCIGLI